MSGDSEMQRANLIQQRVAKLGFDWPSWHGAFDKVSEELAEVNAELINEPVADKKVAEELGDLMFSVINLIRKLELSPDEVLNSASSKFERRFAEIEAVLKTQDLSIESASLAQMEQAWQQVKNSEIK